MWARISQRAALHRAALARTVAVFERRAGELHPELTAVQAAELAAIGLRGALLGALAERAHYLGDPAFIAEVAGTLEQAVMHAPDPLPAWAARSHAHTFRRSPPPVTPLRKQPTQERSRALVEAVVEGTQRVVEREGVGAISTPRVAEVTGVSVGSLYQRCSGASASRRVSTARCSRCSRGSSAPTRCATSWPWRA